MNELLHQILERKDYLQNLQKEIEGGLKNAPQGKLRVCNDRGKARYYHIVDGKDTCGKYLPRNNYSLACLLAQKDYLQKLYRQVEDELAAIELYLEKWTPGKLESVYDELNEYRRTLVTPLVVSDEVFAQDWVQKPFESNPDFTILKIKTREEIDHEHLGMLDDEEYRQNNFVKLDEYRRNGIFPGKNLIITYETAGCYLNIKEIKKMIRELVRR